MRRVALLAAVLLAGCGDSQPTPTNGLQPPVEGRPAPEARAEIGRLLTRRADALEASDAGAYASTSTGAQRAADRTALRNRRGLPLRDLDYDITSADVGKQRAVLRGTQSYAIPGGGTFSAQRRIVAVREDGGWRVAREGSARDRFPWEVEPYAESRAEHFTILAPVGIDLGVLATQLEQARDALGARLTKPELRPRHLVVVARDPESAQRLTAFIRGTGSLAAITDAKVRDAGPAKQVREVVSLRLLVVQSNFAQLAPEEQLQVLTHELTHAALTRVTSGRTPAWLNEGIALYLSGDRRVRESAELIAGADGAARRALTLTALSGPDAIARLAGDEQTAAYAYASAAAHYVADRFGERRLLRLYQAFNDPQITGDGGPETVDAATRATLRRPLGVLERDLRRWIVTRAVVDPLAP
jgi:hypothetical protein